MQLAIYIGKGSINSSAKGAVGCICKVNSAYDTIERGKFFARIPIWYGDEIICTGGNSFIKLERYNG